MSETQRDPAEPFDSATGTNPEPTIDPSPDAIHKAEDSPDTSDENAHAENEQMQETQQKKAEYLEESGIGQTKPEEGGAGQAPREEGLTPAPSGGGSGQ